MSNTEIEFNARWSRNGDQITDTETGETYSLKEWQVESSYLYMYDDEALSLAANFAK